MPGTLALPVPISMVPTAAANLAPLRQPPSTAGSNDASHTRTYCASSDATANEQGGTGNRDSQTFTFKDAANGDYSLTEEDNAARGWGIDLSSIFTDDIINLQSVKFISKSKVFHSFFPLKYWPGHYISQHR